jgi:hypothetical protein
MGISRVSGGTGKLGVHLWQVRLIQKAVSLVNRRNASETQFLHKPVLVNPVIPLHAPFGLRAFRRYNLYPRVRLSPERWVGVTFSPVIDDSDFCLDAWRRVW